MEEVAEITIQQRVKACCELADMTITELAEKMGTSQQNLSKRLKVGKFTQEELEEMAHYLGCKYISVFEFPDGKQI